MTKLRTIVTLTFKLNLPNQQTRFQCTSLFKAYIRKSRKLFQPNPNPLHYHHSLPLTYPLQKFNNIISHTFIKPNLQNLNLGINFHQIFTTLYPEKIFSFLSCPCYLTKTVAIVTLSSFWGHKDFSFSIAETYA